MPEPMTITTLAMTAATLAAKKFVEAGAGEVGKKFGDRLWQVIADRFKGDQRADLVLKKVAQEPGEANIAKLAGYLEDEMELHGEFREMLEAIFQREEPEVVQRLLVGVKVQGVLKAGNVRQASATAGTQELLVNVEAGSIDLGDLTQQQYNPWMATAGSLVDDPFFEDYVAEIDRYRQELDRLSTEDERNSVA